MFTRIYIFLIALIFGNYLGIFLSVYFGPSYENWVFFSNELLLHFFFFYLPLIFLTYVLATKNLLDLNLFFHKKYLKLSILTFFVISIVLGCYEIAPFQILLFGYTLGQF